MKGGVYRMLTIKIRDLHGCKERNRENKELAAITEAVSGKGYQYSFQAQGTDG